MVKLRYTLVLQRDDDPKLTFERMEMDGLNSERTKRVYVAIFRNNIKQYLIYF